MSNPGYPGGEQTRVSINVGDVVAGKFRVDAILGEGGMGVVVAATHLQLRETVALKFLRRELCDLPKVVARFEQEARAAVKLKGEHVAHVLDVGVTDDGTPFYVLEHLEGRDLGVILAEERRLPIKTAVEYVIQACDGLAEAHARGIVHRDIKPENLFVVDRDGWKQIKILDFGISKVTRMPSPDDAPDSTRNEIIGSPAYMSPEQFTSSDDVDSRTDIWSLGAVLFELISGKTPYDESQGISALMSRVLLGEAPRLLKSYVPDVPRELVLVIDKCLSRDYDARFATAAELALALLPFAPSRARVVVEHAVSVTKAAGVVGASGLKLPDSVFPEPLTSPLPTKFNLAPPRVPKFDGYKPAAERSKIASEFPPSSELLAPKISLKDSDRSMSRRKSAEPPASSSRLVWLTIGAAVVAGALAFSFARQRSRIDDSPQIVAPITAAAPSHSSEATPAAVVNRVVKLRIDSEPQGASVREDGVEVCTATPCLVTYEGDDAAPDTVHMLAVTRAGFLPASLSVKASDGAVTVALASVEPAHSGSTKHTAPAASVAAESAPVGTGGAPAAADPAPSSSTADSFKDLPY